MHPLFFIVSIIFFSVSPHWSLAADNGSTSLQSQEEILALDKGYKQAKFYYNQLHTNASLGASRDNWLNGVRNFRKIYLTSPKSEYAAASLYMLGRIYSKMYRKFGTEIDLQESLSYYRDVSDLFPDNRLADDALLASGNILLKIQKNPKAAAEKFSRIITHYRNGDMYPHASDALKGLSQEHGIPLPAAMLRYNDISNLSYVLPVKYWSSDDYTRVVIKASGPVKYKETLLEKQGKHPRRLYIDFQNAYIEPRYRAPVPIEDGLLKQIRTGQNTPENVRVVLDIESISNYKIFSLPDPFRVVVDVRGEGKPSRDLAKSSPRPPAQISSNSSTQVSEKPAVTEPEIVVLDTQKKTMVTAPGTEQTNKDPVDDALQAEMQSMQLSLAQQLGLGVRKIVVDPGHGGKDPGASGFGLREKDIVLKIGQKLAPVLAKETGTEVVLTRDKDLYIPLEERTAIANAKGADLFISLHINAHPSPKVHGLETYYLNLSTNAEAMRVAAFENATSTHQMSDLQDILSDIMKNSKINESSRLAGFVHNSLCNGIKEVQEKKFKDLGVKQAPFYVLIGAEMPAILIEIAFITSPLDSKLLADDQMLDKIVEDISEGVRHYIHSTTASL